MKKSKRPPSRIKYENNNPTVSARLPKEKHDRLLEMLKRMDMSLTQLLLHFIGEYEPKIIPVEEAQILGHRGGYIQGVTKTKERYAVKYYCCKCGQEITVTTEKEKTFIRQVMREHGWGHGNCINGR